MNLTGASASWLTSRIIHDGQAWASETSCFTAISALTVFADITDGDSINDAAAIDNMSRNLFIGYAGCFYKDNESAAKMQVA